MGLIHSITEPQEAPSESYWFFYQNDRLMVLRRNNELTVPLLTDPMDLGISPLRQQYLGVLDGMHCYSAELALDVAWPDGASFMNFIELFHSLKPELYHVAIHAQQIVAWERDHQYCGRCGSKMQRKTDDRAMQCPDCQNLCFPRITPAIMVGILKEDQILLAKNRNFPQGFYSVIAGFAEPGEQLEDCVKREVKEEVGLEIKNLRYFGSQSWPMPNSLMIAYIADFDSGEICVDGEEIIEAGWYSKDNLPKCPKGKLSIAGRILDWFISSTEHKTH